MDMVQCAGRKFSGMLHQMYQRNNRAESGAEGQCLYEYKIIILFKMEVYNETY